MKAEEKLVWDIAHWIPDDRVTDEELQRFLDTGVGTAEINPKCYSVRQFVEAFNKQEVSDMGWLYCTPRHKDGD
jgi:hypothetical protein